MKNNKSNRRFQENLLPSINELMETGNKSREQVLEDLGITSPKLVLTKEKRNSLEEIKQAKREYKENPIRESIIKFFDHKLPSWGSVIFNGMRVKTL